MLISLSRTIIALMDCIGACPDFLVRFGGYGKNCGDALVTSHRMMALSSLTLDVRVQNVTAAG